MMVFSNNVWANLVLVVQFTMFSSVCSFKANNTSIHVAVSAWCSDTTSAIPVYGYINGWNTSSVTNMESLFDTDTIYKPECSNFNDDISKWDISSVTTLKWMFFSAKKFNQPLNSWKTSKVTDMSVMFYEASFNQPLSSWKTSKVTDMSSMFYKASSFNQPLSSWNVSQVEDMSFMFSKASSFNQTLCWNTSSLNNNGDYNMFVGSKGSSLAEYPACLASSRPTSSPILKKKGKKGKK